MDTRYTVRGYSKTASALSDEIQQIPPMDNHLQVLQSITEQLLRLQTDAAERERHQDIEMAERRKREAEECKETQAIEMAKIDAQLKLEEQEIQIPPLPPCVGAQSSNVSCHQSSVALIYLTKERFNHQGISQSLGCKYGIG